MADGSNPLDRTPDMESMSAADRARVYKERAAAAGIGRAPSPAAEGGDAPPVAEKPAAAARPTAAAGNGAAARPAAARPTAAVAVAEPASGKAAAASALTPEQRDRLAAAAQRNAGAGASTSVSPAAEQQQRLVYVWPHLVTIEFMASVLSLLSMILIGLILQSPLEGHANADKTPNPSKAPWYFLNLQELLLHMHPALAGVIVPSAALGLIAMIPYIDRNTKDVGKWFGTPKAVPITWFTTWYSTIVLIALVFLDEWVGVKPAMGALKERTGLELFSSPFLTDIFVPTALMMLPIFLLVFLVQRIYKPDGARDWMICLFTGFFVVYIVLTIVGTFFRGQGMHLFWPWDPKMVRIE